MADKAKQYKNLKKKELEILDKMYEDYEKMASNLYKIIRDHYRKKAEH
jgi:Ethanolamine utilization protein EutJ (predicted chaperonin)